MSGSGSGSCNKEISTSSRAESGDVEDVAVGTPLLILCPPTCNQENKGTIQNETMV